MILIALFTKLNRRYLRELHTSVFMLIIVFQDVKTMYKSISMK